MARATAIKRPPQAQAARKLRKPPALHARRKARPAKPRLARSTPPSPRPAAAQPPTTYPDGRLMMTRMTLPPAQPQHMLIRTTICTTSAPAGRLMPLLSPTGLPLPGGQEVTREDVAIFPPPLERPFPELERPTEGPAPVPPPPVLPPDLPPLAPPVVSAVPEPTTWATMILGLGLAGSVLRYRRRLTS